MIEKKVIITADGFGSSKESNQAVLEGYINGFLTQASLCANSKYFENAVCDILPDCPNLGISAELNIKRGMALTDCPMLLSNKNFNNTYLSTYINSLNPEFVKQVEDEFRAQIEKIRNYTQISCLTSTGHLHTIPAIFNITSKLAKEYEIKYVRTNYEELCFVSKTEKYINPRFWINIFKLGLCNIFTKYNRDVINSYNLKTNDFIVGIGYNTIMDSETIIKGLAEIEETSVTEVILSPKKYFGYTRDCYSKDFGLILNPKIQEEILRMGFEITNFKSLWQEK